MVVCLTTEAECGRDKSIVGLILYRCGLGVKNVACELYAATELKGDSKTICGGFRLLCISCEDRFRNMTAATQIDLMTVEAYLVRELQSEVRHEYLGGYIYAMAGAKNVHNLIAGAFHGLLFAQLRGQPCQPFNSDTKVRVRLPTHTRFYYPDGMVVCEPNPGNDTFQDQPVVIAEVVSEATRRTDEGEKREAYLTIPTLMAYMLIETDRPRVVVHTRTEQGFVANAYDGLAAVIPLDAIQAELRLADLYERVTFGESNQN